MKSENGTLYFEDEGSLNFDLYDTRLDLIK